MVGSHKQRTLRGINWNFLRVLGQTFLGMVVVVVQARLLLPSDFGLVAIAVIFIGFAELISVLGVGAAVIRVATPQHSQIRAATKMSLLIISVLIVLLLAIAQPVANFFAEPELTQIIKVLSVGLWFSGFSAVSRGLLMRRLDFKRLFIVDITAYLFGYAVVGISLAALGFGVWSLVIGSLTTMLLSAFSLLYFVPPIFTVRLSERKTEKLLEERRHHRRDDETLTLSGRIGGMLSFGGGMSLIGIVNYLALNVDYIIVGKFLNPALLGLYSRAYQLVMLPLNKIASTMSTVMFPSFAEIQNDSARIKRSYLMMVNAIALITFPVLAGIATGAEYVIVGLYGENWRGAAEALRILTIAGMLKAVCHMAAPVMQATGYVYAELRRQFVYFLVIAVGCLGAVRYGIEAVSWAVVIGALWFYLSMARFVTRILSSSWKDFISAQIPGMTVAAAVVLAQFLVIALLHGTKSLAAPFVLVILAAVSCITYVLCLLYFPKRIIGEIPTWFIQNYARHAPARIRGWLQLRFP